MRDSFPIAALFMTTVASGSVRTRDAKRCVVGVTVCFLPGSVWLSTRG